MDTLPGSKRPRRRPRTRWRDYAEDLAWSRLGIPRAELPLVAKDLVPWISQFELLPPATPKGQASKEKYTELIHFFSRKW